MMLLLYFWWLFPIILLLILLLWWSHRQILALFIPGVTCVLILSIFNACLTTFRGGQEDLITITSRCVNHLHLSEKVRTARMWTRLGQRTHVRTRYKQGNGNYQGLKTWMANYFLIICRIKIVMMWTHNTYKPGLNYIHFVYLYSCLLKYIINKQRTFDHQKMYADETKIHNSIKKS